MAELVQLIKLTSAACVCNYQYEEQWKEVENDCIPRQCFTLPPGRYWVSNHGRLVSIKHTKRRGIHVVQLNPTTRQGYKYASFKNGLTGRQYVSIIVKWTFDGAPPKPGLDCDHISRIRNDNHLSNLRWLTRSENLKNRGRTSRNPDREQFIPPSNWESFEYRPHPVYGSISACREGIVLRNGKVPSYTLDKRNHGDYWYLGWHENGTRYNSSISKLVYECMTRCSVPDGGLVDHVNNVTRDNRYSNLRLADHVLNAQNRRMLDSNTSEYSGVGWDKKNKYWVARIYVNKREVKESFYSKKDAIDQRLKWEVEFNYPRRQSRN